MHRNILTGLGALPAAVAIALLIAGAQPARPVSAQQKDEPGPERFRAIAANLNNMHGPLSTEVLIDIKQWSTDGQREQLLTLLRDKGEKALLDALQKEPAVGTIRTPDTLAYDLHYARVQPWGDGGQQIVLATDRNITFWEARSSARSLDYPFTVIEMRINANGKGEGRMSLATKVIPAGNQIVLEDYNAQPVVLTDVSREK